MVPGEGLISLRDSEEPFALESPTTITGTIDNGAISGGFSTPTASFELQVLDGAVTAFIDATITEVDPGTMTGSVDAEGTVNLQAAVTLDLHIKVPAGLIDATCRSTPINLDLLSIAPYDADDQRVTVRDPDFTIPAIPITPTCDSQITGYANPLLAGSGHSVTLALDGAIELPDAGEFASSTGLAVTPEGGATVGEPVTLTATVASATAESTDPATGLVDFFDGTTKIGEAALVDGMASFTTTTLGLGDRSLVARYRGDALYKRSDSGVALAYRISASPVFEVPLPSSVRVGTTPVTFPLTLENPSVGSAIDNVRLDVTLERYAVGQTSGDPLDPDDVLLEREGPSGVWTAVTWTHVPASANVPPSVTGTLGVPNGRPLAPGASLTENLRLSFPTGTPATIPGPLEVTFAAVAVDPATGAETADEPVATTQGQILIRNTTRAATETRITNSGPPFARFGGTLLVDVGTSAIDTTGSSGTYHATGPVRLSIDGIPVPYWIPAFGRDGEPQFEASYGSFGSSLPSYVSLAPNVGIGTHTITADFLGDALFAPSSASQTFEVFPPTGTPYECLWDEPFFPQKFIVHAAAEGRLPATSVPGAPITVEDFDLSFKAGRSLSEYYTFATLLGSGVPTIDIDLGEHGEGSAASATQTGDAWWGPDAGPIDWDMTFDGEEGSITLPASPGEVVTTAIEGFTLTVQPGDALPLIIRCEPAGDPIELGDTVVAGTTLTPEAPTPTRADDVVTLRASVSPSTATGVVDFYDGVELVGIAAISNGVATLQTSLDEGARSLTARSRPGASAPSTTSAPVVVDVLPAHDCAAFAEEGNAAVVRLVYMELLGRCPDEAGFEYWTGRLDGGTSPEVFARAISSTPEAVGRVVDDAYEAMLGRAADPSGRAFWVERMRTGAGRYDQLLADLAASPEFWSLSGSTRAGFVTRVYDRLLGRVPEAAGLEYWTDRLAAGASRRTLVLSLANEPEPLGRLVAEAYEEIPGRAPGGAEQSNGSTFLRGTGDRSGLYADLIGSPEFFDRAQGFPNPED